MLWARLKTARPFSGSGPDPVLVKIVTIFLVFIAILAMFGKLSLLLPKNMRQIAAKCPKCGRHRIGKGKCPCGEA